MANVEDEVTITLAPKKLIRTRRASEGSASEPSLARRVSMCKDAKLSCRGNKQRKPTPEIPLVVMTTQWNWGDVPFLLVRDPKNIKNAKVYKDK